jgi:3-mercaptopyruvate sulfurtransferase SseA
MFQVEEFFADGEPVGAEAAQRALRAASVSNGRAVVVYGGWGEDEALWDEGFVWWQLARLGHPRAYILYGGARAWLEHRDTKACDTAVRARARLQWPAC